MFSAASLKTLGQHRCLTVLWWEIKGIIGWVLNFRQTKDTQEPKSQTVKALNINLFL